MKTKMIPYLDSRFKSQTSSPNNMLANHTQEQRRGDVSSLLKGSNIKIDNSISTMLRQKDPLGLRKLDIWA